MDKEELNLKEIMKICLNPDYLTPKQEAEYKKRKAFFSKFR